MGIFHSKIAPIDKASEQPNNFDDPRSPTVNINRSPIGAEPIPDKPVAVITKVRDLTADLTETLDHAQTPDRVVAEKLQSALDPRSPGMFLRTPLVLLDDSDASNVSLRGSSIEYEEIDCDGELSFKDCTATDISEVLSVGPERGTDVSGSIFSNTSLNTELKADIDSIIQKLYDAGSIKDPRSPSVDIQRTPIVFQEEQIVTVEEGQGESEMKEETAIEQPIVEQQDDAIKAKEEKTTTTKISTIVHQDDEISSTTTTPVMIITPKRNKSELSARKGVTGAAGPRTPLGCVTNVQQGGGTGNDVLRKTALIGQLKQSVAAGMVANSAEMVPATKKLQTRSKIPTFRMK
ncbi:uncharacterized protein LOC109428650 [Aedes albopictus]|uniref:Uncharacterized protein n=1 Tax=Aedes albopictus TaxID=7160 RepID=A0ABM1YI48_AEDAL